MRSARWPLLALLGSLGCALAATSRADTIAGPLVPPAAVNPDVPPQVSAAVALLREACAAWRRPVPATPPVAGSVPEPVAAPPPLPERTLCDVADNPDRAFLDALTLGGIFCAMLLLVGFLVFILLRDVLILARDWRLLSGMKSW